MKAKVTSITIYNAPIKIETFSIELRLVGKSTTTGRSTLEYSKVNFRLSRICRECIFLKEFILILCRPWVYISN